MGNQQALIRLATLKGGQRTVSNSSTSSSCPSTKKTKRLYGAATLVAVLSAVEWYSLCGDGFCWASNATLGKRSGVSVRSVQRALHSLMDAGALVIQMLPSPRGTERRLWVAKGIEDEYEEWDRALRNQPVKDGCARTRELRSFVYSPGGEGGFVVLAHSLVSAFEEGRLQKAAKGGVTIEGLGGLDLGAGVWHYSGGGSGGVPLRSGSDSARAIVDPFD